MENNNKQTKSKSSTALIVFLLLVTIVAVILATYAWAKYTSTTTGDTAATVAKWNVTFREEKKNFVQEYEHVIEDRIAPGTAGDFSATIDVDDTEVDVDYKVSITGVTVAFADSAPNEGRPAKAEIPTNMKFTDSEGEDITTVVKNMAKGTSSTPIVIADTTAEVAEGKTKKNNMLAAKSGPHTIEKVLSWDWPYTTPATGDTTAGDDADTKDGQYPVKITVNYKVEAWQVQPELKPESAQK